MNSRITAAFATTVLAVAPFASAQSNGDQAQTIQDLQRQVQELTRTVNEMRNTQSQAPSTTDLDRAIADLASRIEQNDTAKKGGNNVHAPGVTKVQLSFEFRARAEFYSDRTFGTRKTTAASPTTLYSNVGPFTPDGMQPLGSFIGTDSDAHSLDDACRILNRVRINVDVDVNADLGAFFQFQQSRVWGTPFGSGAAAGGSLLPNAPITDVIAPVPPGGTNGGGGDQDQNAASNSAIAFKQAYLVFKKIFGKAKDDLDANLTLGRFAIDLGRGRLLSSADWDNVGRAFDGLKFDLATDDFTLTAVASKVVQGGLDFNSRDTNLLAAWAKFTPIHDGSATLSLTPYTIFVDNNTTQVTLPGAMVGKPWTVGALADLTMDNVNVYGELAIQQDNDRPNTPVSGAKSVDFDEAIAFVVGANVGLAFEDLKPRVGAEFGQSGKLFNDLYASRHGLYGNADVITSLNNLQFWKFYGSINIPKTKIDVEAALLFFRLLDEAGEGVLGQTKQSKNVGQEFDLTVKCRCSDNVDVMIGYSHFFNQYSMNDGAITPGAAYGTSIGLGNKDDADFLFAQIEVRF